MNVADNVAAADGHLLWDSKEGNYVETWPLMGKPYLNIAIYAAYMLFVVKIGPALMKDRPPFKLKGVLLVYNTFQILFSLYLAHVGVGVIYDYGLFQRSCITNNPAIRLRITSGHYLYFLAKVSELLDTVFFVLRKNWRQVSFLHVYHHSLMYWVVWAALKYEVNYTMIFLGTLNSFVHVIMYTYYALSAFPALKSYLWWKEYITRMQLAQFVMIIVQIQYNALTTECPPSYFLLTICWIHALLFIYLFGDFYVKNYLKKRNEQKFVD